jgi:hypothetical protein
MSANYSQLLHIIDILHQRGRTGRLQIAYPLAPGSFYFKDGELVDAELDAASGVDAFDLALSLPDASFNFDASAESTRRTVNERWQQIMSEGIRRLNQSTVPASTSAARSTEAFVPIFVPSAHNKRETTPRSAKGLLTSTPSLLNQISAYAGPRTSVARILGAVLVSALAVGAIATYVHKDQLSNPPTASSSALPVTCLRPLLLLACRKLQNCHQAF